MVHQAIVICPAADSTEPFLQQAELAVSKLRVQIFEQQNGGRLFFEHPSGEQLVGHTHQKIQTVLA